jgi:hypothetical protein
MHLDIYTMSTSRYITKVMYLEKLKWLNLEWREYIWNVGFGFRHGSIHTKRIKKEHLRRWAERFQCWSTRSTLSGCRNFAAQAASEVQTHFVGCVAALISIVYHFCNIEILKLYARMVQPPVVILWTFRALARSALFVILYMFYKQIHLNI